MLPPNMVQCPACNIIIEKASGDDDMFCGTSGRADKGTYEKALRGGGCGYEFHFKTRKRNHNCNHGPGTPANDR